MLLKFSPRYVKKLINLVWMAVELIFAGQNTIWSNSSGSYILECNQFVGDLQVELLVKSRD